MFTEFKSSFMTVYSDRNAIGMDKEFIEHISEKWNKIITFSIPLKYVPVNMPYIREEDLGRILMDGFKAKDNIRLHLKSDEHAYFSPLVRGRDITAAGLERDGGSIVRPIAINVVGSKIMPLREAIEISKRENVGFLFTTMADAIVGMSKGTADGNETRVAVSYEPDANGNVKVARLMRDAIKLEEIPYEVPVLVYEIHFGITFSLREGISVKMAEEKILKRRAEQETEAQKEKEMLSKVIGSIISKLESDEEIENIHVVRMSDGEFSEIDVDDILEDYKHKDKRMLH